LDTFGVQRVTFASGYHTTVVHPTSEYFVDLFSNTNTSHSMTLYRLAPVEGETRTSFTPDSPSAVMQLFPRPLGSREPEEKKDAVSRIVPQLIAFPTTDRKEVLFGAYLKPDPAVFGPGPYKTVIR
jgi:dipeptidyl-peptidase 4